MSRFQKRQLSGSVLLPGAGVQSVRQMPHGVPMSRRSTLSMLRVGTFSVFPPKTSGCLQVANSTIWPLMKPHGHAKSWVFPLGTLKRQPPIRFSRASPSRHPQQRQQLPGGNGQQVPEVLNVASCDRGQGVTGGNIDGDLLSIHVGNKRLILHTACSDSGHEKQPDIWTRAGDGERCKSLV